MEQEHTAADHVLPVTPQSHEATMAMSSTSVKRFPDDYAITCAVMDALWKDTHDQYVRECWYLERKACHGQPLTTNPNTLVRQPDPVRERW